MSAGGRGWPCLREALTLPAQLWDRPPTPSSLVSRVCEPSRAHHTALLRPFPWLCLLPFQNGGNSGPRQWVERRARKNSATQNNLGRTLSLPRARQSAKQGFESEELTSQSGSSSIFSLVFDSEIDQKLRAITYLVFFSPSLPVGYAHPESHTRVAGLVSGHLETCTD